MTSKTKSTAIAAVVVLAVAIAAFVYFARPASAPAPATSGNPPTATSTTGAPSSTPWATFTMAQVTTHANASSCWTAIRGNVYDLTKWIPQHPGGEQAILGICGKDGTAAFVGQHGGSSKQETILATFQIGVLVQ